MLSRRAAGIFGVFALVGAAGAVACGMVPPPEFHEAAKAEGVDVQPLPPPDGSGEDAGVEPDASPDGPNMGSLSVALPWAGVSGMPIARILGKTRDDISSLKAPAAPSTPEEKAAAKAEAKLGWTRFTAYLRIRFDDDDVAVGFEQRVPGELACRDAARWLGFEDPAAPVEKGSKCTWKPGGLAAGVSGELDRDTRLFSASAPAAPQN